MPSPRVPGRLRHPRSRSSCASAAAIRPRVSGATPGACVGGRDGAAQADARAVEVAVERDEQRRAVGLGGGEREVRRRLGQRRAAQRGLVDDGCLVAARARRRCRTPARRRRRRGRGRRRSPRMRPATVDADGTIVSEDWSSIVSAAEGARRCRGPAVPAAGQKTPLRPPPMSSSVGEVGEDRARRDRPRPSESRPGSPRGRLRLRDEVARVPCRRRGTVGPSGRGESGLDLHRDVRVAELQGEPRLRQGLEPREPSSGRLRVPTCRARGWPPGSRGRRRGSPAFPRPR